MTTVPFVQQAFFLYRDLVTSHDTSLSSAVDIRWTISLCDLAVTQLNYYQGLSLVTTAYEHTVTQLDKKNTQSHRVWLTMFQAVITP